MHELGIVYNMLNTVKDVMKEEKLSRVDKITLQIGDKSGIIPYFIKENFEVMALNTEFVKTEIEIEQLVDSKEFVIKEILAC